MGNKRSSILVTFQSMSEWPMAPNGAISVLV
jgi:hypothetical protein